MTISSYKFGNMPNTFALCIADSQIGLRADKLWGAPLDLVEQAPITLGDVDEGYSPASAETNLALGEVQYSSGNSSAFRYEAALMGDGLSSSSRGSSLFVQIHDCLRKNEVSLITTNRILDAACKRCRIKPHDVGLGHLPRMIDAMETSAKLFVEPSKLTNILTDLRALSRSEGLSSSLSIQQLGSRSVVIDIYDQTAITRARSAAKDLAIDLGFQNVDTIKIATVVSELVRNIVYYANRGTLEMSAIDNGIEIIASDSGPGIPHLEDVLNGNWQSEGKKSMGILGSKRMMTTFDISTTAGMGTTVIATKLRDS